MKKMKQVFAVVLLMSMALLGGCETYGGGSSNSDGSQHSHH